MQHSMPTLMEEEEVQRQHEQVVVEEEEEVLPPRAPLASSSSSSQRPRRRQLPPSLSANHGLVAQDRGSTRTPIAASRRSRQARSSSNLNLSGPVQV